MGHLGNEFAQDKLTPHAASKSVKLEPIMQL